MKNTRILFAVLAMIFAASSAQSSADEKPNILWITSEDHGPEMGCYGDALARTPNVDKLAAKGMLFKRAWSVAPVCAPARTAIISGIYPSSSGGIHMRSMVSMPTDAKLYPQHLRKAGYYCTNNSKTDYNVVEPEILWDDSSSKAHWSNRKAGQPFFAIFNSTKSHESQIRTRPHKQITDPARVRIPAFHPDAPEVREDWAQYYDKVSEADADAGKQLKAIADAGLAEDTIVFYYGDHGTGMPRGKRWPSNTGLHVPMVVYFPTKWLHLAPKEYSVGGKSDRMISFVDLAPTALSLAGVEPPETMQGHAFAGPFQTDPQPFLYGERGRMDERMDLVRSVTDGRYVYLRNYFPHVSQAQRVAYQFDTPTTRVWNELYLAGKTNEAQSIFWQTPKAPEELYDLETDRDQVINLARSPEHRLTLERLRAASSNHVLEIRDVGFLPESEMHLRSQGSTPYNMARASGKYPLERILAAADLASRLEPSAASELVLMLKDSDGAIRYWGALGLLMRGEEAVQNHQAALLSTLDDSSADVRIVAAQALGSFGDEVARQRAVDTLGSLVAPETNGVLVSMAALSAVEALGPTANSLHSSIGSMKPSGTSPDGRYDSYVPRLIANIVPSGKQSVGKERPNGKIRKKSQRTQ